MSVKLRITLLMAALLAASSAFAINLGDAAKAVSGATGGEASRVAAISQRDLLNALTSQLGISDNQALGGLSELLGLAKNKLHDDDLSQLYRIVPGLDKLEGSNSLDDVSKEFDAEGMGQGMTGKFASVLLDCLGKQGANSSLLRALGSLWGVGGAG